MNVELWYGYLPSDDHDLWSRVSESEPMPQLSTSMALESRTSMRTIKVEPAENVPALKVYTISEEGKLSSSASMPAPRQELDCKAVNPIYTIGTHNVTSSHAACSPD